MLSKREVYHMLISTNTFSFHIDILTRPDSLQWKGYSVTYANGESIPTDLYYMNFITDLYYYMDYDMNFIFFPAWVPSMVDTDPQMFCKRFQVYLSSLNHVCQNRAQQVFLVLSFDSPLYIQFW